MIYYVKYEKQDFKKLEIIEVNKEYPYVQLNDFLIFEDGETKHLFRNKDNKLINITRRNTKCKSVKPLNVEQLAYMNLLFDDDVKCIIVTGVAGSGKDYCSIGMAYDLIVNGNYHELVIARPPVAPSKKFQMGFIPGSINEKMKPWLAVFYDTLRKIKTINSHKTDIGIRELSLECIKGLSFDNSLIIIDEAEDLTKQEVKSILTRVGNSSKIIVMGDEAQSTESGCKLTLTNTVDAFRKKPNHYFRTLFGDINLQESVRSELVKYILDIL